MYEILAVALKIIIVWYCTPPSPLSIRIMGLGGNSRKIFEFKGVTGKIFINQSLTGVGWLSVVKERRFESRFGTRKSTVVALPAVIVALVGMGVCDGDHTCL